MSLKKKISRSSELPQTSRYYVKVPVLKTGKVFVKGLSVNLNEITPRTKEFLSYYEFKTQRLEAGFTEAIFNRSLSNEDVENFKKNKGEFLKLLNSKLK